MSKLLFCNPLARIMHELIYCEAIFTSDAMGRKKVK